MVGGAVMECVGKEVGEMDDVALGGQNERVSGGYVV